MSKNTLTKKQNFFIDCVSVLLVGLFYFILFFLAVSFVSGFEDIIPSTKEGVVIYFIIYIICVGVGLFFSSQEKNHPGEGESSL